MQVVLPVWSLHSYLPLEHGEKLKQCIKRSKSMSYFEDEDMWLCVTCKACVDRCPR